jgi:hypothetical protein
MTNPAKAAPRRQGHRAAVTSFRTALDPDHRTESTHD